MFPSATVPFLNNNGMAHGKSNCLPAKTSLWTHIRPSLQTDEKQSGTGVYIRDRHFPALREVYFSCRGVEGKEPWTVGSRAGSLSQLWQKFAMYPQQATLLLWGSIYRQADSSQSMSSDASFDFHGNPVRPAHTMIPFLEMGKLRLGEVKGLTQGHTS